MEVLDYEVKLESGDWIYYAEETSSYWVVEDDERERLKAGADYSRWCADTGREATLEEINEAYAGEDRKIVEAELSYTLLDSGSSVGAGTYLVEVPEHYDRGITGDDVLSDSQIRRVAGRLR